VVGTEKETSTALQRGQTMRLNDVVESPLLLQEANSEEIVKDSVASIPFNGTAIGQGASFKDAADIAVQVEYATTIIFIAYTHLTNNY
jgi:hypothetical protein